MSRSRQSARKQDFFRNKKERERELSHREGDRIPQPQPQEEDPISFRYLEPEWEDC